MKTRIQTIVLVSTASVLFVHIYLVVIIYTRDVCYCGCIRAFCTDAYSFCYAKTCGIYPEIRSKNRLTSCFIDITDSVSPIVILPKFNDSVTVYTTESIPSTASVKLPNVSITNLIGPHSYYYNYNGADKPLYLLSGSNITYDITVVSLDLYVGDCPAKLFLFNKKAKYRKASNSSCLSIGQSKWFFSITASSVYYVTVSIDTNIAILTSNVLVYQVYYDTTGLHNPTHCVSSCVIHPLQKLNFYFSCHVPQRYLVLETSDSTSILYNYYITPKSSLLSKCKRMWLVISLIIILFLVYYQPATILLSVASISGQPFTDSVFIGVDMTRLSVYHRFNAASDRLSYVHLFQPY